MCSGSLCSFLSFIALLTLVLSVQDNAITYHSNDDFSEKINESKEDGSKTQFTNSNNSNQFKKQIPPQTLADTLWRTFIELEELLENIVQTITTNVPKISEDADIFLFKLRNYTIHILNVVSNTVLDTGDEIVKEMLYNVERQLGAVKMEFKNLAESVDQHFEWAVNQLNQTLINNTNEYDWWTAHVKHKLRFVNNSQLYKDGCKSIDEFIFRSNIELQNCCKIAMKPMKTLCRDTSTLFSESLHIIVDAIDRMQSCLEDSNSYSDYLVPCFNLAYDDISSVLKRAIEVRHMVDNMLPIKILYTRNCFAIVMVDMKNKRNVIESKYFGRL